MRLAQAKQEHAANSPRCFLLMTCPFVISISQMSYLFSRDNCHDWLSPLVPLRYSKPTGVAQRLVLQRLSRDAALVSGFLSSDARTNARHTLQLCTREIIWWLSREGCACQPQTGRSIEGMQLLTTHKLHTVNYRYSFIQPLQCRLVRFAILCFAQQTERLRSKRRIMTPILCWWLDLLSLVCWVQLFSRLCRSLGNAQWWASAICHSLSF